MKKEELIKALSFLSDILSQMSDEEFRALVRGKLAWTIEGKPRPAHEKRVPDTPQERPEFAEIESFLSSVKEEDEARAFLASHAALKTKSDLLALGRALRAPVTTKQRKDELIQAIVRHAVGRRLQSETISRVTAHE